MKKNARKSLSLIAEHQEFLKDTVPPGVVLRGASNQRSGFGRNRWFLRGSCSYRLLEPEVEEVDASQARRDCRACMACMK